MLAVETILAATALTAGLTSTWSPCGFSMVETIGAAGRTRRTTAAACVAFAAGALAGGVVTYAGLAALGRFANGGGDGTAVAIGVAVALAAALGEARGLPVVPQIRRQVPEPWRRVLPLPVAALLYGLLLGLGFTTYVLTLGVWALAALSFALGDERLGVALGLAFGGGRALPVVVLAPLAARPTGARALDLMAQRPGMLRGFRLAASSLLVCSALALAASATAAVPIAARATDPSVAGGLVAWEGKSGGLLARETGAATDPHQLGPGGLLQLPGRDPALGGANLAYRLGEAIRVVRAADLAPVVEVAASGVSALGVSDRWLVYRVSRAGGGDRLVARAIGAPENERAVAATRPPAQLGRPALDGDAVVFHVADHDSSRIVELDLVTGRRRVLRRTRLGQLSNPAVLGGELLYVRQTNTAQLLLLGARRPGARDRILYRSRSTTRRDGGFERGHSHVTRTPRAGRPASRVFWTTALGARFAYLTLVPVRGGLAGATILRIPH